LVRTPERRQRHVANSLPTLRRLIGRVARRWLLPTPLSRRRPRFSGGRFLLPEPHILAEEIADDLRSALEQIESVLGDLQGRAAAVAGRGAGA
jgi:type I restriction enzyme M protein